MATLIVVEDLAAPSVVGRGGQAMRVLHALEGLRDLGHDVFFCEFLSDPPIAESVRYARRVLDRWWSLDRSAVLQAPSMDSHVGLDAGAVTALAERADAVVTLAAHYRRDPWPLLEEVRPRILFEQDPGYTHLWAEQGDPLDIFGDHDAYFTVGGLVGTPSCNLPTLSYEWHPMWNPVHLDWWPDTGYVPGAVLTTIASWRDYGYLEFQGRLLGPKVDEFERFLDLPKLVGEPIELALNIEEGDPDIARLRDHGWVLEDPATVATPASYRSYVQGSLGEFSCAKGGYVGSHSGWFSDRTACYLASGRPAVVQATGFEELLPTGEGLFAVSDVDEAAAAIEAIRAEPERHRRAAREIAAEFFDGRKVLRTMLDVVGITSAPRR